MEKAIITEKRFGKRDEGNASLQAGEIRTTRRASEWKRTHLPWRSSRGPVVGWEPQATVALHLEAQMTYSDLTSARLLGLDLPSFPTHHSHGTHRLVGCLLGAVFGFGSSVRNLRINHTESARGESGKASGPSPGNLRKVQVPNMESTASCCLLQNTNFFLRLCFYFPKIALTLQSSEDHSPRPVYNVRQPLNTDAYL